MRVDYFYTQRSYHETAWLLRRCKRLVNNLRYFAYLIAQVFRVFAMSHHGKQVWTIVQVYYSCFRAGHEGHFCCRPTHQIYEPFLLLAAGPW